MRILTKTLPLLSLLAFSALACCPGAHAQDAGDSAGSSVFAASDISTVSDFSADGLSSSDFSYSGSQKSSALGSDSGQALTEDLGAGFLGLTLLGLFHGHGSSGSYDTSSLTGSRSTPPSPAAVPEASSVISLGLLLTLGLGGAAVTARKKQQGAR
ncbi:MAG: hypothetical protein ACRYFS_05780 [Janthinobacterium lividum]